MDATCFVLSFTRRRFRKNGFARWKGKENLLGCMSVVLAAILASFPYQYGHHGRGWLFGLEVLPSLWRIHVPASQHTDMSVRRRRGPAGQDFM